MDDTISRQAALDAFGLSEKTRKYGGDHSGYNTMMLYEIQNVIENLPSAQQWHVIEKRPMTEDECKEWSERLGYDIEYWDAHIYSNLPDDGQEVIVCTSWGRVYVDKYADDGDGGYFEENGEIDGIVAWMETPAPYKGNGTD